MSTNTELSIIIPTYNLENYIGATLESVIYQQGIKLEVLVIDDQSSDETKKIVQKYEKKYPYIKLLDNEKSKGVSGARNTGLTHMRGKYCFFLDGDDLLPPNALLPFVKYMEEHNETLVQGRLSLFCQQRWLFSTVALQNIQKTKSLPTSSFVQYIYNVDFIKDNSVFFPEDCSVGEDRIFFCNIFCLLDHIPVIEHYMYLYRLNHKVVRSSVQHALSFIKHFKQIRNILEKYNKMDIFPPYLESQLKSIWFSYAHTILEKEPETIHEFLKEYALAFSDLKEELAPILLSDLGEQSELFWQACENCDTHAMLSVLSNAKKFKEHKKPSYIGINESQVQGNWKFLKILHRLRSIITKPITLKYLWYFYKLQLKSKIFCSR